MYNKKTLEVINLLINNGFDWDEEFKLKGEYFNVYIDDKCKHYFYLDNTMVYTTHHQGVKINKTNAKLIININNSISKLNSKVVNY